MASSSTRATNVLDSLGVGYEVLAYEVEEEVGKGYGTAVAQAIGLEPAQVFKTLVAEADGRGLIAVIPVSERVSTKLLARAAGAKRCSLVSPEVAERWTGYVVGGVSPFGQRRDLPFFVHSTVLDHNRVAVSGGRRGLQLVLATSDLVEVTGAIVTAITA